METGQTTQTMEYKGYTLSRKDPYGFVYGKGLEGVFTTFSDAEMAIDTLENKKPKKSPDAPTEPTKKQLVKKIKETE